MAVNLLRFHGCGTGAPLSDEESAAVVAVRLASLARGHSGVRPLVLERLVDLINRRVLPRIPSEGSVGASGDLTPLSYIAAAIIGEREVSFEGQVVAAAEALAAAGLVPLVLKPKESLALMNGTSMMTGLACLAYRRARQLARLASALSAVVCEVLRGNPSHFDERIFALKPHPGQAACARWLREDLEYRRDGGGGQGWGQSRIQDRYSLRCAPHVIGVLLDALAAFRPLLETEVNSVNDNPIVDAENDEMLHGGNFYECGRPAGPADGAAVQPRHQQRPARRSGRAPGRGARRAPRVQGHADKRVGADGRGAEADHARQRVQP
jgi:histidine ammonia-lyase